MIIVIIVILVITCKPILMQMDRFSDHIFIRIQLSSIIRMEPHPFFTTYLHIDRQIDRWMDGQMDTFPQGKLTVRCRKTSECKSLSKRVKPHGGFPHRVADTVPTGARHQSAALLIADHLVHGCRYCSLPKSSSFSEGSSILQNIYLSIYLSIYLIIIYAI